MTNSVSVENGNIILDFQDDKGNWRHDSYPYTQNGDSISFQWDMQYHYPRITMSVLSAMATFFGTTDIDVTEGSVFIKGCDTCGDHFFGHDVKISNITAGLPYYDHIPKKEIPAYDTIRAITYQNIGDSIESELNDIDESWRQLGDKLGVILFRQLTENFSLQEIAQFYNRLSFNISDERLEKIARDTITRALKRKLKWDKKWAKIVKKQNPPKEQNITFADNQIVFTASILANWLDNNGE